MKNYKKYLGIAGLSILTLIACDDDPVIEDGPTPDGVALKEMIAQNQEDATQHFVLDLTAGSTTGSVIIGDQGTSVMFYPGSVVDASGVPVMGPFDVELIEVFEKSDMLLLNKPTVGVLPSGNHGMLVSGGEFMVSASKDGEELFLGGSVGFEVVAANTGGFDSDMTLFSIDLDCCNDCDGIVVCPDNVWEEEEMDSTGAGGLWLNSLGNYEGVIDSFQWTNIDRFISDPSPKTTILVQAPEEYDETNLGVFISVDGEENLLAALDTYIEADGLFSEHYGEMPIGLDIHVIGLSVIEDQYNYTIKAATITDGEIIVLDDLMPTTEASLITEISNLP